MTTEKSLAPVEIHGLPITASEAEAHAETVIAQYSGWASAIMRVVEAKRLYASIGEKKYLEFEAWQLIGSFDRCYPDTSDVQQITSEDGEIVGYICHAKLIRDGVQVGAGTQMCGLDAYPCQGKNGSAKLNAAISAAQTWAGSKALKMRYSSVAVLGGYGAATGDEMRHAEENAPDKTAHWCEEHQTNWFKKGKMRRFAHPIGDTGKWCNEPESPKPMNQPEPQDASLTEKQLRAAVQDEGMPWDHFEIQVLRCSWADWTRHKGTPAGALARWQTWKADHPQDARTPNAATAAPGADADTTPGPA